MNVFVLIENQYCHYEFDEDIIIGIFVSSELANKFMEENNLKDNDSGSVEYLYRVEEYTVQE